MTNSEEKQLERTILDLPMNDNQWVEIYFFRLVYQIIFNVVLIPGLVIFNFLFFLIFKTKIPGSIPIQIIGVNIIYFALSLPKMITISKIVKKLNKIDVAFYPDFLAINPLLIGVNMKSKLLAKRLSTVYDSLKSGKHFKIKWDNIESIHTESDTDTDEDIDSYKYIFTFKNRINGMKSIEVNRKFFAHHENKFEKLIHKYSGIKVDRKDKTLGQHQETTRMILLIVVIVAIVLLVADKLGFDPASWPIFRHWLNNGR